MHDAQHPHPPAGHATSVSPAEMGRLVRRAQGSVVVAWIVFALGIVLLLAWAGLSAAFAIDQLHRSPPGDAVWIGPLVMAFLFVPFGAILAVKGYQGRVLRVDLHEGGVAYRDNKGEVVLPWADVVAVWWRETHLVGKFGLGLEATTRRLSTTRLDGAGGRSIVVDERFPDHVRLAAQVRDAAAEAMLPRFEGALSSGLRIDFGAVGVDAWGLHLLDRQAGFPWSAIGRVRWESRGATACYVVQGTNGAHLAEVPSSLPNEVVFQVVLHGFGKLGDAHEEAPPVGDEILATARRLFARRVTSRSS